MDIAQILNFVIIGLVLVGIAVNFKQFFFQELKTRFQSKEFISYFKDEQTIFELKDVQVSWYRPLLHILGKGYSYRYSRMFYSQNFLFTNKRVLMAQNFLGTIKYDDGLFMPYPHQRYQGEEVFGPWGIITSLTSEQDKDGKYLHLQMSNEKYKYKIWTNEANTIYQGLKNQGLI